MSNNQLWLRSSPAFDAGGELSYDRVLLYRQDAVISRLEQEVIAPIKGCWLLIVG
jgi:hypothetical protein